MKKNSTSKPNSPTQPIEPTKAEHATPATALDSASTEPHLPSEQKTNRVARFVSLGLLVAIIGLLGFVFYEVMVSFMVPLFLAALLVVMFSPLHRWFLEYFRGQTQLAALLTTLSVVLTVLLPLVILLILALAEGREVVQHFNSTQIVDGIKTLRTNFRLNMPAATEIRDIETRLLELQQDDVLDDRVIDQHRSNLYAIEESAKLLATATSQQWPQESLPSDDSPDAEQDSREPKPAAQQDDVATNNPTPEPPAESEASSESTDSANRASTDPIERSAWEDFYYQLRQTRTAHFKSGLIRQADETETDARARLDDIREYKRSINKTAIAFTHFKSDLLGGRTRAWLAELVNPTDAEVENYSRISIQFLRDKLFSLGGDAVSFLGSAAIGFAIMVIGLYFFLLDGPGMLQAFHRLSPIDDAHERELMEEFSKVSRAVVVATLLSALAQGLLAGIGFYFAGLESIFLLTVLSAVLAMVPFVGAAAVWVPCCLYLYFFNHDWVSAIGLAVYGFSVISMADNFIKPYVLHGQSNLHPLLALLSVLGGVATLGPIGILVGPMIVAFLQALLKILQREIVNIETAGQE